MHTFHKFCLLFRNIFGRYSFFNKGKQILFLLLKTGCLRVISYFSSIYLCFICSHILFQNMSEKKFSIPGQKDFLTIDLRDWYIFAYILYTILKFHNLFNYCNLLSTWKKEQFGKNVKYLVYQKPDLHIIIQCYMFYIREWMTKIKKMVCGKIEYVLIIFFL